MRFLSVVRLRLRSLLNRKQVENDLQAEMQFHLEQKIDQLREQGMTEAEARRVAQREFGSVALHADECRDKRGWNWLDTLTQDVRYSARALLRTPGFTALAICSLALGIGSTVAIYSVFDVAVLHPLPIRDASSVVWFEESGKDGKPSGGNPARLLDWQRTRGFESVAGFYSEGAVLLGESARVRLDGLLYMGKLPQVLEARLQFGRFPSEQETRQGAAVLLLTDATWQKVFHADPQVLHRTLRLANKAFEVVGVLDRSVRYPESMDFWAPAPLDVQQTPREAGFLAQAARLCPGTSLEQAQAEVNSLTAQLALEYAATDAGRSLRLQPLAAHVSESSRKPLLLFFAAALGVLLIACVNVSGLLLARGLNRQREASIRVALGAGQSRLVRLFLTESFLLAAVGCLGGVLLSVWGLDAFKAALPEETPRLADAAVNRQVLLFAAVLSLLTALLCGLLPAWKAAHQVVSAGLKEGSNGSLGAGNTKLRSTLVMAEVAVTLLLLVVGGLLINSFVHLRQKSLGFEPQRAHSFSVSYPWDTPSPVIGGAVRQVLEQLSSTPGVQYAGVVDRLPLHGGSQSRPILIEGLELPPNTREQQIGWRMASDGYFPSAGIPLISGSLFQPYQERGLRECVINQQLASLLFKNQNPVGRRLASRSRKGQPPVWYRIAGVVGDTRLSPSDSAATPEVYVPWGADYWPMLNFVVRTSRPLADVASLIRSDIEPQLAGQVVEKIATLEERTEETRTSSKTRAWLAGTLAGVALILSSIGLFALLAHETVRRTREYGVRLAFGANPSSIAWDALRRGLRVTLPGIGVGLLGAYSLSRALEGLLFEVHSGDPLTYAIAGLVLLLTALAASAAPAIRAARVDPLTALRHE